MGLEEIECAISYHKTQITPLVKKISVDIDTIRLREIGGDQLPNSGEVDSFMLALVLDIV